MLLIFSMPDFFGLFFKKKRKKDLFTLKTAWLLAWEWNIAECNVGKQDRTNDRSCARSSEVRSGGGRSAGNVRRGLHSFSISFLLSVIWRTEKRENRMYCKLKFIFFILNKRCMHYILLIINLIDITVFFFTLLQSTLQKKIKPNKADNSKAMRSKEHRGKVRCTEITEHDVCI